LTAAPPHSNIGKLASLTHIEIDVVYTYEIEAIPVESTQIRTGGSLRSVY
jgi:hypothetical protein